MATGANGVIILDIRRYLYIVGRYVRSKEERAQGGSGGCYTPCILPHTLLGEREAESVAAATDPTNLIWVMPAKGSNGDSSRPRHL
jgi:hypothetical protein